MDHFWLYCTTGRTDSLVTGDHHRSRTSKLHLPYHHLVNSPQYFQEIGSKSIRYLLETTLDLASRAPGSNTVLNYWCSNSVRFGRVDLNRSGQVPRSHKVASPRPRSPYVQSRADRWQLQLTSLIRDSDDQSIRLIVISCRFCGNQSPISVLQGSDRWPMAHFDYTRWHASLTFIKSGSHRKHGLRRGCL